MERTTAEITRMSPFTTAPTRRVRPECLPAVQANAFPTDGSATETETVTKGRTKSAALRSQRTKNPFVDRLNTCAITDTNALTNSGGMTFPYKTRFKILYLMAFNPITDAIGVRTAPMRRMNSTAIICVAERSSCVTTDPLSVYHNI